MARTFTPPPITISVALSLLSGDMLRPMMRLLPIARPLPTRKANMVATIEGHLAGDSLRKLWDKLDETQQLAVCEALHAPHTIFDAHQFKAKYGKLPFGFDTDTARASASPLRLFLYASRRYETPTTIPADLAQRLRAFVTPPPEATVAADDELPEAVEQPEARYVPTGEKQTFVRVSLTRRDMERAAQHDLLAVLRLIDGGRVAVSAKTRRPSAAASRHLGEVLSGGDFFDPTAQTTPKSDQEIGPIRAFAWPCLVQAAKLAELRGSRLALTKAGRSAVSAPPAESLRRIWKRWLGNTLLDEFSRVDAIKGQSRGKGRRSMTAASGRRPVVADALAECPVGQWVRFDDFSQFMQAASFDFDVTHDPWNLYLSQLEYGTLGYNGSHDWPILEGRYVLCLLFEYAATLGLIDVAYTDPRGARPDFTHMWGADYLEYLSRYDGLHYFRLNPLGAYCLRIADAYKPSAPPARAALTVYPGLWLQAGAPLSPDERLPLENYANAEADGVWRLDGDKALSAIESGHDPEEFRKFLAARDDQPLPETVDGFLRNAERGARALALRGTALLIECADAEIAARLATDARTAKLCLRAGERRLVVRTTSEKAFRKAARALGYGMPVG